MARGYSAKRSAVTTLARGPIIAAAPKWRPRHALAKGAGILASDRLKLGWLDGLFAQLATAQLFERR
jgi:hypothetical protein